MKHLLFAVIVVALTSFVIVPASAGDLGGDLLKALGGMAAQKAVDEITRPKPVEAERQEGLPRLLVRGDWPPEAAFEVRQALGSAGFTVLTQEARQDVSREMRDSSGREYNSATTVAYGQLYGTELYAEVELSCRKASSLRVGLRDGRVAVGLDGETNVVTVDITVTDHTGSQVATATGDAPESAIGVEVHTKSVCYAGRKWQLEALKAASQAAANKAGRKVKCWQEANMKFDPATGAARRTEQAICNGCGATIQKDWVFCGHCGRKLQ